MKRLLISTYLIASSLLVLAQSAVQAKIDPIEMLIGEQAQVTLTIPTDGDANIEWPKLQPREMLVPGVEIIGTQHPDSKTVRSSPGIISRRRRVNMLQPSFSIWQGIW